jgi:hypothetical protein
MARPLPPLTRWALLLVVLWQVGVGALYARLTPAWQAPDEPAHFNYARQLGTTGTLPVLQLGDYDGPYLEQLKARRFPPELSVASVRYEGHQPPAYYLLAALLAADGEPRQSLLAVRLLSVLLGALVVLLVAATVHQLFPVRPDLALLAAAVPALIPQHLAILASASNDSLASVAVALTVLLTVRLLARRLRHGERPTVRQALALGGALALCLLTKLTAYAALPVALLALRWAGGRGRVLALAFLPPIVAGLGWALRNVALYGPLDPLGLQRHDAVVAGQPLTGAITPTLLGEFARTTFRSFWGQFGWMGVPMEEWVYAVLAVITLLAGFGLIAFLHDCWRGCVPCDRASQRGVLLLGLLAVLVVAGFLWYNLRFFQPQGRYLYPAMPAIAVALAAGLRWTVSARWGWLPLGLIGAGLAALDLYALFRYVLPSLSP